MALTHQTGTAWRRLPQAQAGQSGWLVGTQLRLTSKREWQLGQSSPRGQVPPCSNAQRDGHMVSDRWACPAPGPAASSQNTSVKLTCLVASQGIAR